MRYNCVVDLRDVVGPYATFAMAALGDGGRESYNVYKKKRHHNQNVAQK